MNLREFAGVLAHEFGHFAQGTGMRLTYIIRTINGWFARVVYERDEWDINLEKAAKEVDLRIGIILHLTRLCIWLTRRILWVLMQAGHAISCFMLLANGIRRQIATKPKWQGAPRFLGRRHCGFKIC